jgi:hypothetical protein
MVIITKRDYLFNQHYLIGFHTRGGVCLLRGNNGLFNTGRFIMYSGITNIYYRKTIGHVFTKAVQIEGTETFFHK